METQLHPEKKRQNPRPIFAHVYCGKTAGWIKMPLGTELNLGPGDVLLDGVGAPHKTLKGAQPQFSVHVYCGQTVGWMKAPLGMEVYLARATLC